MGTVLLLWNRYFGQHEGWPVYETSSQRDTAGSTNVVNRSPIQKSILPLQFHHEHVIFFVGHHLGQCDWVQPLWYQRRLSWATTTVYDVGRGAALVHGYHSLLLSMLLYATVESPSRGIVVVGGEFVVLFFIIVVLEGSEDGNGKGR